jgi:hypothetical protein
MEFKGDLKKGLLNVEDIDSSALPTEMFEWTEPDADTPTLTLDSNWKYICTDLDVLGDLDVTGDLDITGNITGVNDVTVDNDLDVGRDVTITGDIDSVAAITTTSDVVIGGQLTIDGASRARAYLNSAQNLLNVTTTKIQLDGESYDNLGEYDNATNYRFTATVAGYYLINANLYVDDIANGGYLVVYIYKNGASIAESGYQRPGAATDMSSFVSTIQYLAASDYIEMYGRQSSGATRAIATTSPRTYLEIHRLS